MNPSTEPTLREPATDAEATRPQRWYRRVGFLVAAAVAAVVVGSAVIAVSTDPDSGSSSGTGRLPERPTPTSEATSSTTAASAEQACMQRLQPIIADELNSQRDGTQSLAMSDAFGMQSSITSDLVDLMQHVSAESLTHGRAAGQADLEAGVRLLCNRDDIRTMVLATQPVGAIPFAEGTPEYECAARLVRTLSAAAGEAVYGGDGVRSLRDEFGTDSGMWLPAVSAVGEIVHERYASGVAASMRMTVDKATEICTPSTPTVASTNPLPITSSPTTSSTQPASCPTEGADVLRGGDGKVEPCESIRHLQRNLTKFGYAVDIDGVFGPSTTTAVEQFQADQGLTVDGLVGSATWTILLDADSWDL